MNGRSSQAPSIEDFHAELAYLALGWRSDRHLPAIAMIGLEAGLESPALAALAGEGDGAAVFELRALFKRALRQLNLSLPAREEAEDALVLWWLRRLVAGQCGVTQALRNLVDLERGSERKNSEFVGDALGIERFVGIYWEIADGNEAGYLTVADRQTLEMEARDLASAFVDRLGPR